MISKLSEELTMLTTKLMMCASKREIINISGEFGKLIEKVIEQESNVHIPEEKSITATIKFTKEEVANMAKTFKKEFIANGLAARVIKRQSGKNTFLYEIRYRRNGYRIEVSSTDINEAKRKFIEATKPENIDNYQVRYIPTGLNLFREIANEWLAYKKGKINDRTYNNYESYYRRYIRVPLGEIPILKIRTLDVDKILNGKPPRLYEDLRTVLNSIFKYAIGSGIMTYNPVTLIPFKKAERNERRALTKDEQTTLLQRLSVPEYAPYKLIFLIMLYFGLRPCELSDARFDGDFLIARNAKRKNGKIEYKKIPVPKQAREKLDLNDVIVNPHRTDVLNRIFKRIIGNEKITQYYLRHTFATTCQQYVRPDIVDIWMGDSSERLVGRVYTHFPDEFMKEQMDKVYFDI
ncbi:MAG: tyrosine-type recombinase/integrase family protein [Clostridia bacterium]|nr:tyrosine-type recombinase/integrase family protein [Clostridia bacterium]